MLRSELSGNHAKTSESLAPSGGAGLQRESKPES